MKVEELIKIFSVSYRTIYNWFYRWESEGILGLYNKPGRGRKSKFNSQEQAQIKEWTKQEPRQLKQVKQKIQDQWKVEVSIKTIQKVLKTLKMSWHRMRRGVGGEPNPQEYEEKKAQLEELQRLEDEGKINLYYLDETGFSLIPCIPYGWQDIGEYLPLKEKLGWQRRRWHLT